MCLFLVLGEDILYTLNFAIISGASGDIAIDAGANTNVSRNSRGTFLMDSGVAVVDSLTYFRPRALCVMYDVSV
jgi:hypothetical protein